MFYFKGGFCIAREVLSAYLTSFLRAAYKNEMTAQGIPPEILRDSGVTLLALDGNPVSQKELQAIPGYAVYEARFSSGRRKIEAARATQVSILPS